MAQAVINEQSSVEEFAELAGRRRRHSGLFSSGLPGVGTLPRGLFATQTWLIGIANNLIRDARRGPWDKFQNGVLRSPSAHRGSSIPDPRSSPEGWLMAKQEVKLVWKAMAEDLSPNQCRVFFLRFMKERNFAEIETITGIRRVTIRVHLSRAARSVRLKLRHQ